jgi:hypothetical protein
MVLVPHLDALCMCCAMRHRQVVCCAWRHRWWAARGTYHIAGARSVVCKTCPCMCCAFCVIGHATSAVATVLVGRCQRLHEWVARCVVHGLQRCSYSLWCRGQGGAGLSVCPRQHRQRVARVQLLPACGGRSLGQTGPAGVGRNGSCIGEGQLLVRLRQLSCWPCCLLARHDRPEHINAQRHDWPAV